MREYKFRGQRQSDNKWIYGDLLQPTECCDIYEISDCESFDGSRYDVIKDTIGQFTGLHDKNGKEIYEGDIIDSRYDGRGIVKYGEYNCSCCNGIYGWHIDGGDIRYVEKNRNNNRKHIRKSKFIERS